MELCCTLYVNNRLKTILFMIASKALLKLGINVTIEVKDPAVYKTLMRGTEEDKRKWKDRVTRL